MVTAIGRNWWQRVLFSDKATQSVKRKKKQIQLYDHPIANRPQQCIYADSRKDKILQLRGKEPEFPTKPIWGHSVYHTL